MKIQVQLTICEDNKRKTNLVAFDDVDQVEYIQHYLVLKDKGGTVIGQYQRAYVVGYKVIG